MSPFLLPALVPTLRTAPEAQQCGIGGFCPLRPNTTLLPRAPDPGLTTSPTVPQLQLHTALVFEHQPQLTVLTARGPPGKSNEEQTKIRWSQPPLNDIPVKSSLVQKTVCSFIPESARDFTTAGVCWAPARPTSLLVPCERFSSESILSRNRSDTVHSRGGEGAKLKVSANLTNVQRAHASAFTLRRTGRRTRALF